MDLPDQQIACLRMAIEMGCKPDSVVGVAAELMSFIASGAVAPASPAAPEPDATGRRPYRRLWNSRSGVGGGSAWLLARTRGSTRACSHRRTRSGRAAGACAGRERPRRSEATPPWRPSLRPPASAASQRSQRPGRSRSPPLPKLQMRSPAESTACRGSCLPKQPLSEAASCGIWPARVCSRWSRSTCASLCPKPRQPRRRLPRRCLQFRDPVEAARCRSAFRSRTRGRISGGSAGSRDSLPAVSADFKQQKRRLQPLLVRHPRPSRSQTSRLNRLQCKAKR